MVTSVNHGPCWIVGAETIVRDPAGDWRGTIRAIGVTRRSKPVVGCTDPLTNPHVRVGQEVIIEVGQLGAVPR